jgi:Ras-related protein Rap-1B
MRLLILFVISSKANICNRELYMQTGQGFLLVFTITSQSSLTELSELRKQIIRVKKDESVPMVIVGNNSDLEDQRVVSRTKALAVSSSWGSPYYETSQRLRGMFVTCLKLEYQCALDF